MPKSKKKKPIPSTSISPRKKAKLAVAQHEKKLKEKFPNIISVSDAVRNLNKKHSHVVVIYLKDDNDQGMPSRLSVRPGKTKNTTIATEIVKNLGTASIHIAQSSSGVADINSVNYVGSICCLVNSKSNPLFLAVVTSGHIYTRGNFENFGGILSKAQRSEIIINGENSGNWYLQIMNNQQDLAIARLKADSNNDPAYRSFANGFYTVTDKDVRTLQPNVTILSKNYSKDGFVLDYNVAFEINYHGFNNYVSNIILVGSTNARNDSKSLTVGGDSGSCVFHKNTGRLVGMLLGGNDKFSFVLPVKETLDNYNFKPI